jgi:hypothetical protein
MIALLPGWAVLLIEASRKAGEDSAAALRLVEEFGRMLPEPSAGILRPRRGLPADPARD